MKKYEIVYIIHPDLEGSTAKITEKVKAAVEKSGKVLSEESWGKKKLAYEIGKNTFGIYEFLLVETEPESLKEIERSLRLSEEVIRSMVAEAEKEAAKGKERIMKVQKTEKTDRKEEKSAKKEEKTEDLKVEKKTEKTAAEKNKEEKERQKELDEKLQEIIGPDKES